MSMLEAAIDCRVSWFMVIVRACSVSSRTELKYVLCRYRHLKECWTAEMSTSG